MPVMSGAVSLIEILKKEGVEFVAFEAKFAYPGRDRSIMSFTVGSNFGVP